MLTETKESNQAWIELRQQVNFWKAQHERATQREQVLRKRVEELENINRQQTKQIKSLTQTEKYLFQRPLHRILETLKLEGLVISQGIF